MNRFIVDMDGKKHLLNSTHLIECILNKNEIWYKDGVRKDFFTIFSDSGVGIFVPCCVENARIIAELFDIDFDKACKEWELVPQKDLHFAISGVMHIEEEF